MWATICGFAPVSKGKDDAPGALHLLRQREGAIFSRLIGRYMSMKHGASTNKHKYSVSDTQHHTLYHYCQLQDIRMRRKVEHNFEIGRDAIDTVRR